MQSWPAERYASAGFCYRAGMTAPGLLLYGTAIFLLRGGKLLQQGGCAAIMPVNKVEFDGGNET